MTRAVAAALVGTVLERRYRIDTFIGAGEKGALIFRAHEIMTGEHVAVRCPGVPDELAGLEYEQALDAFLGEAKILEKASGTSEDVESLLAYGIASPKSAGLARFPFCVFEWLEGKSLEQHVLESAGSVPSIGEALAILEPAARALAAVHALGVTHKDVRPRNLWLASAGARTKMKLTQFVLASRIGGSDDAFAPEYAAPEHFKRSYGAVGPHTDVYGLALCLVELVSGRRRALEGDDATELYLATSDLVRRPTLRARGVQISDAVEAVIAKAVAVDPKRRWQNARELWDALVAAVPELTPLMPSVRPRRSEPSVGMTDEKEGQGQGQVQSPPIAKSSAPSMWSARDQSSAVIIPAEDARLGDSAKLSAFSPPDRKADGGKDRTNLAAWLIVALVGAVAVVVVVLKLTRSAPATPKPQPSTSTSSKPATSVEADAGAGGGRPASSAPKSTSSEESAVMLRPFLTDMVRVPAGKFMMGTDKEGKPAHAVKITKPFFIDRTEVTAEMYSACIEEGACAPLRVHSGDGVETAWGCNEAKDHPKYPANCVDRGQAERFCVFSQKRLPSEAEWEYAARGTDGRDYPWGNTPPTSCATAIIVGLMGECRERRGPMEVAQAPDGRSAFGALDMAGNVWEWVADGYEAYPTTEVTDPHVPLAASGRGVLRGGSWDYSPLSAKATFRYPFQANTGNVSTGFRCARDAHD